MNVELIDMFDLHTEVDDFIKKRVSELAPEKHEFKFSGSGAGGRARCKNEAPHIPHIVGWYNTVRYGSLENYCSGIEGKTPQGDLHIIVKHRSPGDPATPARISGFWFIK